MPRLVRSTHLWMWVVWAVLFAMFALKYLLVAYSVITLNSREALILSLVEDGCWIILQPLSSVLWIQKHWKEINFQRKLTSWAFFIVPAIVTFMLYSNMIGEVVRSMVTESNGYPDRIASMELILEGFWIYFPLANLISWFTFKSRTACRSQRWNCRYLFTPAVVSLTTIGCLHLFVFVEDGTVRSTLGVIEECLWVYIPFLGNICGRRDHRRHDDRKA